MEHLDVGPLKAARGTVKLPGSKSISNRVLLLAALAEGETVVRDLLDSDDTRVMLAALDTLGVRCEPLGTANAYRVTGTGGRFPAKSADLFMGNAGTAIRPLTAALALQGGEYTLHGVPRMHERPIGDLVDGLRQVGARIDYTGNEGFPPLAIRAASIRIDAPIRVRGDVSSQFLTALLMALPLVEGRGRPVTIEVVGELISKPYIEITLNLMARFGVQVERNGWASFSVPTGVAYRAPGEILSRATRRPRRTSWRRARSAAGRCAWKGSACRASRATCALPMRSIAWAPTSWPATTGSKCAAWSATTASCMRWSSTAITSPTPP